MKYCSHCGQPLVDGATFCVNCGKAVEDAVGASENRTKYCTYCGAPIDDGADYCNCCGRKVGGGYPEGAASQNQVVDTVAKVFMVLTCVASATFAIAFVIGAICLNNFMTDEQFEVMMGATEPAPAAEVAEEITRGTVVALFAVLGGICALSLAWCIPLTVYVFNCIKQCRPISTSVKVCILLFVDLIAGILLLCRKEPNV